MVFTMVNAHCTSLLIAFVFDPNGFICLHELGPDFDFLDIRIELGFVLHFLFVWVLGEFVSCLGLCDISCFMLDTVQCCPYRVTL